MNIEHLDTLVGPCDHCKIHHIQFKLMLTYLEYTPDGISKTLEYLCPEGCDISVISFSDSYNEPWEVT